MCKGAAMKLKILNNEKGSIFIIATAVIVAIVSFLSSAALIEMVNNDFVKTQYQHDKLQEELFLRTELERTALAINNNKYIPLPDREGQDLEMHSEYRRANYKITNIKAPRRTGYAVQSLIEVEREGPSGRKIESPIKRMTERFLNPKSLAEYQYMTMTEQSENADGDFDAGLVKFWGPDELYGPVHSNSDIWIQQAGGGNNGGWPTFYDKVTTTGRFMNYNTSSPLLESGAPVDDIFRDEYQEEVPDVGFNPNADDIRQFGTEIGGVGIDIVYVEMANGSFSSRYGVIVQEAVMELPVYSWYPHNAGLVNAVIAVGGNWYEDSDEIWTNTITKLDTAWSPGPNLPLNNNSFWVPYGELWIEGNVAGNTSFGCADTVFIVGDITYAGTPVGAYPDGFSGIDTITGEPQYEGSPNLSDYFGLVSEQKILIRYKHKDPDTDEIITNNCDQNVYLYGAFAAIAQGDVELYGDMACHYDGIFTFQYPHGHGSTPNFVAPTPYLNREFTIELNDNVGDGWNGAYLDVTVDGSVVLNNISCYGSQSNFSFTVSNGDVIETNYTPGTNNDENSYIIYDHNNNLVMQDGPDPGAGLISPMILITPTPEDDTLYTYVDLHKFIFPKNDFAPYPEFNLHGAAPPPGFPSCGFPYEDNGYINSFPNNNSANYAVPYGTDYPWYNPVWPESSSDIVWERGDLHIYGAVAQTRRGFIHRSGGDDYNHPQGLESPSPWEMDQYHFDGDHPSCGFDKDYYYDIRFLEIQPIHFPKIHENWGQHQLAGFTQRSWYFKSPDDFGF